MNTRWPRILLASAALIATSLACATSGNSALLTDDFAGDETWGTGTDADHSTLYSNETLTFSVAKDSYYVWSLPNDKTYENVHVEVTALNNSTDETAALGIVCDLQLAGTGYSFAITGAGTYGIVLYTLLGADVLTNDGKWAESSLITPGAASYRLGADCGSDGTLTLYVDGQKVDSVVDTTYSSGNVGLFAWSGQETGATNVSYDDFVVTELK
jgi:hypothetical protein